MEDDFHIDLASKSKIQSSLSADFADYADKNKCYGKNPPTILRAQKLYCGRYHFCLQPYSFFIRVHPRPVRSFFFDSLANEICVFLCSSVSKNGSESVRATRRVARTEFGVKGDKACF